MYPLNVMLEAGGNSEDKSGMKYIIFYEKYTRVAFQYYFRFLDNQVCRMNLTKQTIATDLIDVFPTYLEIQKVSHHL